MRWGGIITTSNLYQAFFSEITERFPKFGDTCDMDLEKVKH